MRRMALATDEELGKRDDDFRPRRRRRSHLSSSSMTAATFPFKWRRRRVLGVIGVLFLIFVFRLYVPSGLGKGDQTDGYRPKPARTFHGYDAARPKEPTGAPPKDADMEEDEAAKHYYNGPTKFYKLGGTLQKTSKTMSMYEYNRNVLFAAASMKSVANLIPMACEMAKNDKNYAHLAVFGRSPLTIEDIQELNGVDKSCGIYWHDARGDYAAYSSEARVESAVRGAMQHIQDYLHPQVVIMDDSAKEEAFFTKAMRTKAKDMNKALIEIPQGKYEEFLWMTKLGAGSLAHWFSPTIDIVIQAPLGGSGRLIRLLQSLYNADYRGLKVPRINIELPPDVEPALQNYLNGFSWPPNKASSLQPNLVTVHHRIPSERLSSEQASLRFVESFYPAQTDDHHVLLLSPQAELSPLYYQYLQYVILNYRYSSYGYSYSEDLLGLSLDVPSTSLNGTDPFKAPSMVDIRHGKSGEQVDSKEDSAPFLYQAPSTKATLVFGDKWAMFHDFLTNRLQASHSGRAKKGTKFVSETEPAWLEYLLELMSARNLFVMHPAAPLVTIHNELAQIPEEYQRPLRDGKKSSAPKPKHRDEEPFTLSAEAPVLTEHVEADLTRDVMPLHRMLPFGGELQDISRLPLVGLDGNIAPSLALFDLRDDYVKYFRSAIGGCTGEAATRQRKIEHLKTDDLFCLPGHTPAFLDDVTPEIDFDVAELMALPIAEEPQAHPGDDSASRRTSTDDILVTQKPITPVHAKAKDSREEKKPKAL